MNWDRIEGNWKQFAGKVKDRGASSLMTRLLRSTGTGNNSKARFKRATDTRRIKCGRRSTTGSAVCDRHAGDTCSMGV
jgi:hypothetical protein